MTTWIAPAYAHIKANSHDELTQLTAAVEALDAAYDTAAPLADGDPEFDPLRGATFIDLALLILRDAHPEPVIYHPHVRLPDDDRLELAAAAAGVKELLLHTADLVLAQANRPDNTAARTRLLGETMDLLGRAYQSTFGRAW